MAEKRGTPALTQAQAAAVLGVTARRLRQLDAEEAKPPRDEAGEYPCREFGDWLNSRWSGGGGFDAERTRLTRAQADKTELEVAEKRGTLLDALEVERTWAGMLSAARTKLLAFVPKVAHRVMAGRTYREVEDLARSEVHAVLSELADDGDDQGSTTEGAETVATAAGADG